MRLWPLLAFLLLLLLVVPAFAVDTYMGYVSSATTNGLYVIDVGGNGVQTTFSTGNVPVGLDLDPTGKYLYVVNNADNTVTVYDVSDYTLKYTISLASAGSGPNSIVFTSTGTKAYVSMAGSSKIAVIDVTTKTLRSVISVNASPENMVYKASTGSVYVQHSGSRYITRISTLTDTVTASFDAAVNVSDLAAAKNTSVLLATCYDDDCLQVFDASTGARPYTIVVGNGPQAVVIRGDDTTAYVVDKLGNDMKVVSLTSWSVTDTVAVGTWPMDIDINGINSAVYVMNAVSNTLSVVDTTTNTVTTSIALPGQPARIVIRKVAQEASNVRPMQVTFNVNKGGITMVPNANVSIYDANTGVFIDSDTTDTTGSSIIWLIPGKRYNVDVSGAGISVSGSVQVQPNDQYYYIDVSTWQILSSYQYSIYYKLHTVQLTMTRFLFIRVKNATVDLSKNGTVIQSGHTDDYGQVAFHVQSEIQYEVHIYNVTSGINVTRYKDLSGDSYTIDVTGAPGGYNPVSNQTSNVTGGGTGHPDRDITTSVTPAKSGATGNITCNYTDISGSTTQINISIYTRNMTKLMLFGQYNIGIQPSDPMNLGHTEIISANNGSYVYSIAHDPAGEDYLVIITGTYTTNTGGTGTINRQYMVTFKGPTRLIPYWPSDWYKYLSWMACIGVGLVARKPWVEEIIVVLAAMASSFYALGWLYELGDGYMIMVITILWVVGVGLIILKREREARY